MIQTTEVLNPYQTYVRYLALKRHFTTDYDFFRYNGKVSATPAAFEKRKDKYYFEKLSKKKSDPGNFLLANLSEDPNMWVGEMVDGVTGDHRFGEWVRIHQSLTYTFEEKMRDLLYVKDFPDLFRVTEDSAYPFLLKKYLSGDVPKEVMVILNRLYNYSPYWNSQIKEDLIWPQAKMKLRKYDPFMQNIDLDSYRNIMKRINSD